MSTTLSNTAAAVMNKRTSSSSPSEDSTNSHKKDDPELAQQQGQQPQPESLYQINRALIRMLMILSNTGDAGLYTRELLDQMGSIGYAQKMLKLGENKGYIRRVRNIKPDGKGNYRVMNYVTPKGKALVNRWTQAANENNSKD